MKKITLILAAILIVAAIASAITGLMVWIVYYFPAEGAGAGWFPTYATDASADAKEIAAALSTPPTHLVQPMKYALYHWQTLIAGVLAFFGGLSALAAAYVGALELRSQTNANRDIAEKNINSVTDQLDYQKSKDAAASRDEIKGVCRAFHAEVFHLYDRIYRSGIYSYLMKCKPTRAEMRFMTKRVFVDNVEPPMFDSLRNSVGKLPDQIPKQIVVFYSAYRDYRLALSSLKSGVTPIEADDQALAAHGGLLSFLEAMIFFAPPLLKSLAEIGEIDQAIPEFGNEKFNAEERSAESNT
ncbi:hypothetical protein [Azospirillum agricola]|uniref:hypothetical protein n=1 Tax=Azospirillum agricola TaxID=1720247 RepID=UPI000A0F1276|nr:hypothetical protein [Azospirillum agricola]SMH30602.1 hypothetical protein SAMN02982994_0349 [Azospirillum lipoferum]